MFSDQGIEFDILKPFTKSSTETSAGLMLDMEWDRSFEKLFLSSRRMSLSFDSIRIFTAQHTMVQKTEIDEAWRNCYPRLLGTGVALKSGGALFRRHTFELSPTVRKIRSVIPQVPEDDSLAKSLNDDQALMKLVSRNKPDVFTVDLSVGMEDVPPDMDPISFMIDPRGITWAALIEIYITRGLSVNKAMLSVLSMLDIAIAKAVANSNKLREQAAGE